MNADWIGELMLYWFEWFNTEFNELITDWIESFPKLIEWFENRFNMIQTEENNSQIELDYLKLTLMTWFQTGMIID